jgi:hypothetical protein
MDHILAAQLHRGEATIPAAAHPPHMKIEGIKHKLTQHDMAIPTITIMQPIPKQLRQPRMAISPLGFSESGGKGI